MRYNTEAILPIVLEALDIPVKIVSNGKEFATSCFFCGDTKKRLYINRKKGIYWCWNCEATGTLPSLVADRNGIPIEEAWKFIKAIAQDHGHTESKIPIELEPIKEQESSLEIELPSMYRPLWIEHNTIDYKTAIEYFESRGFGLEDTEQYRIGYCSRGKYKGRIIIPVFQDETLVYFVARDYTKTAEKRYLNPPISTDKILFNYDSAKRHKQIILTEGALDTMKMGPQSTGLFSKVLHTGQMEMLLRTEAEEVVICLDPPEKDPDITKDISRIVSMLGSYFKLSYIYIPEGKDPGECTKEEMAQLYKERFQIEDPQMFLLELELLR